MNYSLNNFQKSTVLKSCILMISIFALILTTGCGGKGKTKSDKKPGGQPDWVLNTPVERGFLYGVGSAEIFGTNESGAASRAKDIARVELVKQIEVNVSGVVEQEIKETMKDGVGSLTENLRQAVSNQVPEFKLTHVKGMDSHKSGKRVYALVQLDVTKELQSLRRQISDLDDQIDGFEQKFNKLDPHGMSAVRLVAPALVLVDQRAAIQARHNKLSSKASPLLTDEIREFVSRVYERIGQMKIAILSEGEENASLKTGLIASLTKKGMRISETGDSDVQIVYKLNANLVDRGKTVFVITRGDVWIKDEQGRVVKALQAKAKGVSTDSNEANSRSISKLSTVLSKELMKALF